jgi:RNA exonuclease 4
VGAPSLDEALVELKRILPVESVIVGQSIKKDLEWLLLEKDKDYKQMFDVADLFRIPMQSQNGTIRYRYFSLRHVAKYLLGHNIQVTSSLSPTSTISFATDLTCICGA